jgi:hypothetical protein
MTRQSDPPPVRAAYLIRPRPFLVNAVSRAEAFELARKAIAGAQFDADALDDAAALIEDAEDLKPGATCTDARRQRERCESDLPGGMMLLLPIPHSSMDTQRTPPAPVRPTTLKLINLLSERYGISTGKATRMLVKFLRRQQRRGFDTPWLIRLMDAQFMTHLGRFKRIRCGREMHLAHLIPEPGGFCHDCGCARGEYHVFGCDAEECSHCGEQAFCCECDAGTEPTATPDSHGKAH